MFTFPMNWKPVNYIWYQGNNNYCCFVTRVNGNRYKTELYTKNGTHLQTEFLTSLKRAMKFSLFFLDKKVV
jgi:hypothetical protein